MPYNGVGVFQRLYNWTTDQANGILVRNDRMDADTQDIADGLSNCITKDGQSVVSANIPMSTFKFTGLGAGAAPTDSVNYGQVFTSPTFAGMTATGTVTFSGATTVTVPTVASGDNSTKAASTAFATALAFAAALPAQALGFLSSTGLVASFTKSLTFGLNAAKAADVASAAAPDIWAGNGNTMHITGTTTLTGFAAAPQAGACRTLYFDGACLLTNSANFNVQGAADYTTAAGDVVDVYADTTTKFYLFVRKSNGQSIKSMGALLAVITPTVAANINFLTNFAAAYDNYLVIGDGILPAADGSLAIRLANAGTADSGSNYFSPSNYSGAAFTTSATSINLSQGGNILAAGIGANFELRIKNVNDATRLKTVTGEMVYQLNATPGYAATLLQSVYSAANAVSGFGLFFVGGQNFAAVGKVRLYGYNNT